MSIRPRRAPIASGRPSRPSPRGAERWTFLSNHAHVLLCLTSEEGPRLREVAKRVGITERAVQKIVLDLEEEGILERRREGRCNRYRFHLDRPLRHPLEAHRSVRVLLGLVLRPGSFAAGAFRLLWAPRAPRGR